MPAGRNKGDAIERERGEQPIAALMARHGFTSHDLVASSTEQITHKMVGRAMKGRLLTTGVQTKLLRALNKAAGKTYRLTDLFNYRGI